MSSRTITGPSALRPRLLHFSEFAGGSVGLLFALVTAVPILLFSGVSISDIGRLAVFEVLYVLLPGCLLYRTLTRRSSGWLPTLAIGWPLGYAIEIAAFTLSAATSDRALFLLLPLLALLIMGPFSIFTARRSHRGESPCFLVDDPVDRKSANLVTIILALGITATVLNLGIGFFAPNPLPEHVHSIVYNPDIVLAISLAAEARHHWPLTTPYMAGMPLRYYTGFFMHAAALNQVTDIPLSTIVLRLFPVTMIFLIALQLWLIGRMLGSASVGALSVIIFFLVGDPNLDPTRVDAFGPSLFGLLTKSPTYMFAIPFLLALLVLSQCHLMERDSLRHTRDSRLKQVNSLIVVGILVLGASAIKTFAAVCFIGGLGIFCCWRLLTRRHDRLMYAYFVISLLCFTGMYLLMLKGGAASTLGVHLLHFVDYTIFYRIPTGHSLIAVGLVLCVAIISYVVWLAPLLGAAFIARGHGRYTSSLGLFAATFGFAMGAHSVLGAPDNGEIYFAAYGYLAAVPLAALGLTRLWQRIPRHARTVLIWSCAAILILGLSLELSTRILTATGVLQPANGTNALPGAWVGWYVAAYAIIAVSVAIPGVHLQSLLVSISKVRPLRIAACAAPLFVTFGFVNSLGLIAPQLSRMVLQKPVAPTDSERDRGMNGSLYGGLIWVRDHTPSCAILEVNNHYTNASQTDSRYYYYSAFSERRVFLESWGYDLDGEGEQSQYLSRLALTDRATLDGDPEASNKLRREGVDFILIDKTHDGGRREQIPGVPLVFASAALDVYSLIGPGTHWRGC